MVKPIQEAPGPWTWNGGNTAEAREQAVTREVGRGKLPWREAGPPNHHDDKVDSGQ